MRLFVAANPSIDTRRRLSALRDELRSRSTRGSFVPDENLHLTLVFLGECDPEQISAAKKAMDEVEIEPFGFTVDRVDRFRRPGGDIWWAGLRRDDALLSLQANLSSKLASFGFALEERRYNPHITLGRRVITGASPWTVEPFGETIYKIDLMSSERVDGRQVYASIYRKGKWARSIRVEPYDPDWTAEFRRIADSLLPHIKDSIVAIHHVGSTSVEGLPAKPIIDIDVEIPSVGVFPAVLKKLQGIGYRHEGDLGIPHREAFARQTPDGFMNHHLYVCPSGSRELLRHLAFRDHLRAHPALAKEYGELKIMLARAHASDIDKYIEGKSEFIESILKQALV